jgi:signal transduction histidine kinase
MTSRALAAAAIALSIGGIGAGHHLTPDSQVLLHSVLEHLYVLPVAVAGLFFGWKGGLPAAILAVLCFEPGVLFSRPFEPASERRLVSQIAEMFDIVLVGVIVGAFADVQRRQRSALEQTTRQLSTVYRELQDNFDRLKRSERLYAIGQLSAGLAHEIRNPLASIAGATGILQRHPASPEKRAECLDIISRETQRLNRLLTSFLNFARPRPPEYQFVEPGPILDSVVELAAHAIDRKPITFRKHVEADMPGFECDPEQIQQVLLNLLINAVQAMDNGGGIVVSACTRGGKAVIEIRDQGGGVSQEHWDRIFDPFFTTKENGTGLGLSVAHQIVAQHGGVLTAERNQDGGMTFSISLPFARARAV